MSSSAATFILVLALTALCSMAYAADPQAYRVDLASVGNSEIDSTLKSTSDLVSLRTSAPVSPFGLIARARSDVDRLTTVLESFGYYESRIQVKINGILLSDPGLGDVLSALPHGEDARVAISFTLGTLYTLRRINIEGELPDSVNARAILRLNSGQPAVASTILGAGARLLTAVQEQGYAFAAVPPPVAYQAADAPVLDLTFNVTTGQKFNIGEIQIEGLQRVHESLARHRLTLHTGELYKPSAIERARKDLLALNVFAQVSVQIGTQADASDGVPITFKIRERLRHAVSISAAYSSDLGGSGGATWSDRNVFGNGEQLSLTARVIDLTGSDTTGAGYDTSAKYLIPEFGHRDQSLQFVVGALKQSLQAYDQTSKFTSVTLSRKLSSVWSVSVGVSLNDEVITQNAEIYDYRLFALPLSVGYDSTNLASPLQDPTHGFRGSLIVTPTLSSGTPSSTFIISFPLRPDAAFSPPARWPAWRRARENSACRPINAFTPAAAVPFAAMPINRWDPCSLTSTPLRACRTRLRAPRSAARRSAPPAWNCGSVSAPIGALPCLPMRVRPVRASRRYPANFEWAWAPACATTRPSDPSDWMSPCPPS